MITTLIFDLGNVALTNDDWYNVSKECGKKFSQYYKVAPDNMVKAWKSTWPSYKTGKITENEFFRLFLEASHSRKVDVKYVKKMYRKSQNKINNMPQLIRLLKSNYKIGFLTNASKEWLKFKLEKFNLDNAYDQMVASCHFGIAKPDIKIYQEMLKKLKNSPKNCVFIDDKESNLLPAKKLGMKTILFKSQKEFEKDLAVHSIKV